MWLRVFFGLLFAGFGALLAILAPNPVAAGVLFALVFTLYQLREREREKRRVLGARVEGLETDIAAAYQLLIGQNTKLLAAVESLDAALVVCDSATRAQFVNPAATPILRGATPILGENVAHALRGGELDEFAAWFENLRDDSVVAEHEIRVGNTILEGHFTPLHGENREFLGAMLVVADVSAQRELDSMKTNFIGFVAHELRSPLTTILGYANLLDAGAGRFSAEQLHEMAQVLARHCRRMNRLVADLLDMSHLEAGAPIALQPRPLNLSAILNHLAEETRACLNATPPLEIVVEAPDRLPLLADLERVEQIVSNLLSNAVKYSPDGGTITLRAGQEEEGVILEVADEGMGLSAEQLRRLFSRFYRTEDAKSRGIKGNGLGLNLVRQLVEAHGGTIEAFSKRDEGGKGATFRIWFPGHSS